MHVFDSNGNILGRVRIDTIEAVDEWTPTSEVIAIINDLKKQGRL